MDYSQLSDFEINKLVESALRPGWQESDYRMPKEYCNNPSNAWPIIVSNKINIYFSNNDNLAQFFQYGRESVEHADWNPLRAAMIVFLKMQESANVQDNPA